MRIIISIIVKTIILTGLINNLLLAQTAEQLEEQRALGFIKAIQAGDTDKLLAYMHDNWVPAEEESAREARWPGVAKSLIDRHKNVTIEGVLANRDHELTIITIDPDGMELSFIFEFDRQSPYRVLQMGIEAGGQGGPKNDLPVFAVEDGADVSGLQAALSEWFTKIASDDEFSGTALVAWKGKEIFSGAYGLADKRWEIPNSPETRFDLGSINKSFTQIAIGQLVRDGKMSFDDRLADLLPDYPNREAAEKIDVRQLLNHTSGLGDIFTEEFFNSSKSLYRKPRDFFDLFAEQPLQFQPGHGESYSNAGYMVLGALVEAVSGQSYYDYVTQHIFEPAGMANTGFFERDDPVPNVAEGYTKMHGEESNGKWYSNAFMLPIRGNSAGSAQSTAADLLRFDEALRSYRLLPPDYTDWYYGGPEPSKSSDVQILSKRAMAATGIAGGAPGVNAALESDGNLAIIILSNYDAPIAEAVARSLHHPLLKALGKGLGE